MYVSITGLALRKPWHWFRFYKHAASCLIAARNTEGNIMAMTKTINGVRHTLSAWHSREAMLAFVSSTPHIEAIKMFPSIAMGKTFGFEADVIPDWDDVHRRWAAEGVAYTRSSGATCPGRPKP